MIDRVNKKRIAVKDNALGVWFLEGCLCVQVAFDFLGCSFFKCFCAEFNM